MSKMPSMPRNLLSATSILMLGTGLFGASPVSAGPPDEPSVVEMDGYKSPGNPGGELNMLVGRTKDTRLMAVYGYARLVAYNEAFELVPDILNDVDVEDGRVFTMHLRPGHRWSDGEPFTSEDFRYWWEDVANNEQLSPTGPPAELYIDGEPPKVEFPDERTVRYSWSSPNPFFLPALAGATPTFTAARTACTTSTTPNCRPCSPGARPRPSRRPGSCLSATSTSTGSLPTA